MTPRDYDVVIVGARCAGATLAIFLARAGARVLLLDKDRLPSDQIVSTHLIGPPGIDVLDEVGVGEAVRAAAPAARVIRMNVEGTMLEATLPDGRAGYCPRRARLDGLLQRAAVGAGAELLDRSRVIALVQDGERVRGVRFIGAGGERTIRADLVVGADGRRSTVARFVAAEEYLGYDGPRSGFWGYWPDPDSRATDPPRRSDLYFSHCQGETAMIFPTDDDQLVIGSWPTTERGAVWRRNPESALCAMLAREPRIAPLVAESRPIGKVVGTVRERFFFRTGAGPGWALVGDAGHHKDFVIGDGITEALLQARNLAAAIATGTDAARTRWWRARDVAALPIFFFGKEASAHDPLPDLYRVLLSRLQSRPDVAARLLDAFDRRTSPLDAIPAAQVFGWALAASLGGRPQVMGELLAAMRRTGELSRELRLRAALLERDAA